MDNLPNHPAAHYVAAKGKPAAPVAPRPEETIITKLARSCRDQVGHLKGKKRDEATIAFWSGAMFALHHEGHEDAAWVSRVAHLLIATRGFSEVESLIKKAEEAKQ